MVGESAGVLAGILAGTALYRPVSLDSIRNKAEKSLLLLHFNYGTLLKFCVKKIGRMRKARAPSCHIYFQENTWILELPAELFFFLFLFSPSAIFT